MTGETPHTATSSRGAVVAELAGELQREVAAERIAGDRDPRQAVALDQLAQHEQRIGRQAEW